MTISCIFGLQDPLKPEVPKAVRQCKEQAGLRLIMLTGDNAHTANAIAKQCGIQDEEPQGRDAARFSNLTGKEFRELVGGSATGGPKRNGGIGEGE